MFLSIYYLITYIIIFNHIFKTSVIPQKSKFNYMIAELFPLHSLIAIDIHFFKKINQCQCKHHLKFLIRFIIIKVFKHNGYKFINRQPFLFLLKSLLNDHHLFSMKHLKDLRLCNFVFSLFLIFISIHFKNSI